MYEVIKIGIKLSCTYSAVGGAKLYTEDCSVKRRATCDDIWQYKNVTNDNGRAQ